MVVRSGFNILLTITCQPCTNVEIISSIQLFCGVVFSEVIYILVVTGVKEIFNKMYKLQVDPTLCRLMEIYRRVGIWRNEEESDFRKSCMRILYFLQYFSFLIYVLIGAYIAYLNDETNQLIFLVEVGIAVSIAWLKLSYLLWRKDEILNFLYDPIVTHCTENYGESLKAKQKIRKFAAFIKVYTVMIFTIVTTVSVLSLPIFMSDEKMLPLFIRFNSESDHEFVLYWSAYLFGTVGCLISAVYTSFLVFIWYILYNYSIEYKLQGHRFRSIGTTASDTYHQELIHLIRAHNKLFK